MNEFLRCVLESNPFAQSAVGETADAAVHVEAVHQGQFQELVACAEDVRRTRGHLGRVVWGEAGVGKSHLLVQLDRWARRERRAYCPIVRHLDANAGAQPWHIVKSVLRQMTRDYCQHCPLVHTPASPLVHICACRSAPTPALEGPSQTDRATHGEVSLVPWRQMPLYRVVRGAVEQAMGELPPQPSPYRAGQVLDVFHRLVDHRLQHLNGSRSETNDVCDLLFRFFLAAERNREHPGADRAALSALQWLSGIPLDSSEAAQLGLFPADLSQRSVSLPEAATAQSVLIALAELASLSDRAMILCFDQVDELLPEQAGALAQFLHPLVDHARNLLVVLSGQQQAMLDLVDRGVIAPAAWDRLDPDRSEILLTRIPNAQARKVLEARLRRFVEPFLTLPKVRQRVEQDPLFPLGSDWFSERIAGLADLPAREVIDLARDRWHQQQAKLLDLGGRAWLEERGGGRGERGEGRGGEGERPVVAGPRPSHDTNRGSPNEGETSGPAFEERGEKGEGRGERGEGRRETRRGEQSPLSPLPSPLFSPPSRRESRLQEIAGWSTSAVLLGAIALVLWGRSSGFVQEGLPAQAVGWDKRSAGPPRVSPSHGGPALRLFHPTATPQWPDNIPADKNSLALKDDRDNDDDFQGDLQGVLPAPTLAEPPRVVVRTEVLTVPAATQPLPRAVARAPPGRSTPTRNGPVVSSPPRQLVSGVTPGRPVVPPAPLAATAQAVPPAEVPADAAVPGQPVSSPFTRRRASRSGQTAGTASSRTSAADAVAAQSPVKPLAVSASPEVERLLDEAWGLIERGDVGPGRSRLLAARKADQDDLRADFSLGLLDALDKHDWDSAGKHFADCLRRDRENIPTLNNLAIVLVQSNREAEAAKHWKAILGQQAATAELVQNVGIVRHLMEEGMIRKNNSLSKTLEHLYTEAAVATAQTCQPQAGFRFMGLALADGRFVGFTNAKKMQLAAWTPAPAAPESGRPAGPQPAARNPGTPNAANPPSLPSRPGPTGIVPAAANAPLSPAANVFPNPAANVPVVPRPGYRYQRR